jgi:hypothetical protein
VSIAAKLVLLLACLVAGFAAGVKWHAGQDAIAEQARQVNQRADERLRRQNANTAAVAFEGDRVRIETEFRDVIKEVDRVVTQVVYRDTVCLPPDGLRVIESAIARAYGDPGEPGNAVPNAAAPK